MKRGIAIVASVALLVPAGVARAGDHDVIREGSCSGSNDGAGADRFTARARNVSTGEVCRGAASI